MRLEWHWRIINEAFKGLTKCKDRYLILYGGRGSSKSDYATKQLVFNCLTHSHFRCIMMRKVQAKVKDSCYQSIKDTVEELGLEELFQFSTSPTPRITCKVNGNFFIGAGLDDVSKIKSVKDPTCIWWEEDIPEEDDFITVTTSVRTPRADYLQEIFTINPECEGDYRQLWFYKWFFEANYEKGLKSFSDKVSVDINGDGNLTELPFTVHHSTYNDNPHLPEQFKAILNNLKTKNPYYYTVYALGLWGTRIVGGRFYKNFKEEKHTSKAIKYNPDLPLHIAFDFNVNPYVSISIWQIVGLEMRCIDIIPAREPDNNTAAACRLFLERYGNHYGGLFVYGDPAGRHEDTRSEQGFNDFTIIEAELARMYPEIRLQLKAPSVVMRGNFINAIFESQEQGLNIQIAEHCTELINDLLFGKQASDGTKHKEKVKDKDTGVSYEKYHHFSDGMDYFICTAFEAEYEAFQSGGVNFDYRVDLGRTFKR